MSQKSVKIRGEVDMLQGPLLKKIVVFAIPLLLSGVLQQSFNSVDVAVVGRYCSRQSLAAVGSNGVVIGLLVNLFLGISIGANVVIANCIGRGKREDAARATSTVMVMSAIFGVFLGVIGILASGSILRAIATPDDVLPRAEVYLRLFFIGVPFLVVFNFASAVLRSVGDTRRPFNCLVAGGVVNVGLNLLLVLIFDLDVAGVAIATSVSNVVSATLLVRILMRERGDLRLDMRQLRFDRELAGEVLRIGVPAGVQAAVFPLSNVFILSAINTFGADGSAGSAAALTYEYYCYYLIAAFASASVAFTGQNYGAGKYRRCDRIFLICLAMGAASCAIANIGITIYREWFVGLFTSEPDVSSYGYIRIEHVLLFQFIASSYEVAGASMRGMGKSVLPALITIFGTCIVRIWWVSMFQAGYIPHDMGKLLDIYPITWILTGLMMLTVYRIVRRKAYKV
ncbi:MAG: MATE family efflux transporter [Bacteroidales bacterium]|nr:MATE family efflux transporter [Bacteroidales bacterium]